MNTSTLSAREKALANAAAYKYYVSWRARFVSKLAISHIGVVIIFDILAIYFPGLMTKPVWQGSLFTTGVLAALLIISSVIFFTFYYNHRTNQEYLRCIEGLKEKAENAQD